MTYPGLLPRDGINRLRDALISANYTAEGIAERLGPDATAAVARNDFRAALKITEDRDPLATLIRLYICGQTEPKDAVKRAFKDLTLDEALAGELIQQTNEAVRPTTSSQASISGAETTGAETTGAETTGAETTGAETTRTDITRTDTITTALIEASAARASAAEAAATRAAATAAETAPTAAETAATGAQTAPTAAETAAPTAETAATEAATTKETAATTEPAARATKPQDGFRAGIDLEPYGDGRWILADLAAPAKSVHARQTLREDHVLGIGGASTTLANAIIRDRVATALDLGTGCGVQALHLSEHVSRVTATDLSERALRFAATAATLAGLEWDLRRGDMIQPVSGERFDLVVSNPPFVVGPGTMTHTYRDSGRPGDAISAELAAAGPSLLNPGGTLQFLANWLHVRGEDWADRVAGWFAGTGMDVWVIQREISDPMAYVDLWLNDAGEAGDPQRAAAWLDWFDAHRVEAVGFGIVTAKNNQRQDPVVRVETLRQPLAQPFGPQIKAWFERQDWLRAQTSADALLDTKFVTAAGLSLHQEADHGPDGWDVTMQSLVQTERLGWSEEIDPTMLVLIGGCDGTVTMADQLAVMAAAYDTPESTMRAFAAVIVPHLVERGFIEPVDDTTPATDTVA